MYRLTHPPRLNWNKTVESQGMRYHTIDGEPYWDETASYRFEPEQIDILENATNQLHILCLDAVRHIIEHDLFHLLQIPPLAIPMIIDSFQRNEPSLYGRFDLAFDGVSEPKLLEYNADTPTALLEAAVIQWFWLKDTHPEGDQFNSIHERLIDGWKQLEISGLLHFASVDGALEDLGNLEYLRDTAIQAGIATSRLAIEDIGYEEVEGRFVDLFDQPIDTLFKLYPWEWMVNEYFGRKLPSARIRIIEPSWKMLLSNKGVLAILWQMFEGHPNLLPAFLEEGHFRDNYVTKPLLSREGENITICRNGQIIAADGSYGGKGMVWQQLARIPCFDGNYPVTGSWVIAGEAAGIGIREDRGVITTNCSRFVPHFFQEG